MDLKKEKQTATKAIKRAGNFLLKNFGSIERSKINFKEHRELVSRIDIEAEKIILDKLMGEFPEYEVLAEESGKNKNKSDWQWVIDPLDGTSNYLMGLTSFGVSIALLYKGDSVLGLIYIPFTKELYVGEKGRGAYVETHGNASLRRKALQVSVNNNLKNGFLVYCAGRTKEQMNFIHELFKRVRFRTKTVRIVGSAVVECVLLASGKVDAYVGMGLKKWDLAAGSLIIKEAGGHILDFEGKPWQWGSESFLATNGKIDREILEEIGLIHKNT